MGNISIHTPTKGVTVCTFCKSKSLAISIHTPTKGVTILSKYLLFPVWYFNPHSHEGSDFVLPPVAFMFHVFQSTLPRREWQKRHNNDRLCSIYFNPHSHEGSDVKPKKLSLGKIISIHTPTKGVTQIVTYNPAEWYDFNPHSHEGSDVVKMATKKTTKKFQSTLPRREWLR